MVEQLRFEFSRELLSDVVESTLVVLGCSVGGCCRRVEKRGLCGTHYQAQRRFKLRELFPLPSKPTKCSADNCEDKIWAHGYCRKHYKRWKAHGSPYVVKPPTRLNCAVTWCTKKISIDGLCERHYFKKLKHGDPNHKGPKNVDKLCLVNGCNKTVHAHGFCPAHYQQRRLTGKPKRDFDISVSEKVCRSCGILKMRCEFHVTRDNSDGLSVNCAECQRIKAKSMRCANPEHYREQNLNYRRRNRERVNSLHRINQKKNWPQVRESKRKWAYKAYQQNPDKFRRYNHNRRARRIGNGGTCSASDLSTLMNRHYGLCAYCCVKKASTIDHVIPISRGGTSFIGNMLPSCGPCNFSKNNRTIMEWRLMLLGRKKSGSLSEFGQVVASSPTSIGLWWCPNPVKSGISASG